MNILLKYMAIVMSLSAGLQAMDVEEIGGEGATTFTCFNDLPEDLHPHILQHTDMIDRVREDGHAGELASVCKNWYKLIKTDHQPNLSFYSIPHNMEESCLFEIWRNAKLIYTKNDGTTVDLPFSVFPNSLTGELVLSACENASTLLSISLGYRTAYNPANANKVEIWICLRDMIQKNVNGDAAHYARYLEKWPKNAPIGIFWNSGGCNGVVWRSDYLISHKLELINNEYLLKLWMDCCKVERSLVCDLGHSRKFHVHFNKN